MLGDHGEFAAWTSAEIIAATITAIHSDGKVDLQITKKDGSHWIEPKIRVAQYLWEWDAYLLKRAKWREFYLPALKSAYEEFGHDPLPLLYYDGRVYLPNGPVQPFARIVMETPGTVNVFAAFSDQLGESFFKNVVEMPNIDDLDIWTLKRSRWLPILSKWTARAVEQMVAYAGPDYLNYV